MCIRARHIFLSKNRHFLAHSRINMQLKSQKLRRPEDLLFAMPLPISEISREQIEINFISVVRKSVIPFL